MPEIEPVTKLGAFGSDNAVATPWAQARGALQDADLYWLSTIRPDGRPHVTPLIGVWLDGALHFCTGSTERKAKNLAENRHCILTTGRNELEGLDLVVEGEAIRVTHRSELEAIAECFESKYGPHFTSPDGTWSGLGDAIRGADAEEEAAVSQILVFRVAPAVAFGFGKGTPYSQTRWAFR